MDFEFDLPIDPSEIDEAALENKGRLPSGYYQAEVMDCYPDQKDQTGIKVIYKITAGPFAGREVPDTIWNYENSDTDDKKKHALNRMLLVLKRLGARDPQSTHINLRLAIGKHVVIQLGRKKEPFCESCREVVTRAEGDRSRTCPTCGGKLKWVEKDDEYANVQYEGVYPLDHPKIPDEVRVALDLPAANAAADDGGGNGNGKEKPAAKPTVSKPAKPAATKTATPALSKEQQMANAMAGF